jgi:hypothetical protein
MWKRDSPVNFVSLHWWPQRDWSLWPRLRRASSRTITRLSCHWSHTAFLSRFHTSCSSSFRLHNRHSWLLGGTLWRACNLTVFTHSLTGPVGQPVCSLSWGTRVQSPGGYLCETGILLLALSYSNTSQKQVLEENVMTGQKQGSESCFINWVFFIFVWWLFVKTTCRLSLLELLNSLKLALAIHISRPILMKVGRRRTREEEDIL